MTPAPLTPQQQLTQLKREMKQKRIRRISCFNAGLTAEERHYNTQLFNLTVLCKKNAQP